ncbi:MAG: TonB-dependent siderophore receptor [Proteobacteria bacterium]|nr:TonB-dependent siderophore receptor [Pseudomonadota bacterium]
MRTVCAAALLALLAPAAHAQSGTTVNLNTIQVDASKQADQSADTDGYVAKRSTAATKTNTPWIETPQSVSTVTGDQMRDQNPATFAETVRYSAGVKGETFGSDYRNDWFLLRGFTSQNEAIFLDGMQLFYTSYASWKLHPYALDRIDVLLGPSASLYSGGSPGGVINATSKKPPMTPQHEIEVGVNNYGNRYVGFDIGGPLAIAADHGKFYYRLTGWAQAGDTQVDYTKNEVYFINPALTWKPNLDTTVTLLASVMRTNANGLNFLPYEGTVTAAPYGRIATSTFTGEPSNDKYRRDQQMVGYQFETALSDSVTFRQNARYAHVKVFGSQVYGAGYATTAAAANLARANYWDSPNANLVNLDNQLEYKFNTGPLSHTALAGADLKYYTIDDYGVFAGATPINLINPVYTSTPLASGAPFQDYHLTQRTGGVYGQDQIKLGRVMVTLGGRYDSVRTENDNHIGADQNRTDGRFSGRAAISYLLPGGVAPYLVYSTSYNPVIGTNSVTKELLEPETGRQFEAGVKVEPTWFNGHFSAAYFDLARRNVLTTDPSNPQLSTQTGAVKSRGWEFEAVSTPLPGLKLKAAYTIYDMATTEDLNPANIGKMPTGVPEQFGSVWADYTLQSGTLAGFGFGGGVRYVGASWADTANAMPVPDYTLVDATVHYEIRGWRAAINVTNLFDKIYVASCSSPTACYYGDRMRTTASLAYRW